jgi:hypothetical protein
MDAIAINNSGIEITLTFPDGTTKETPSPGQRIDSSTIKTSGDHEYMFLY